MIKKTVMAALMAALPLVAVADDAETLATNKQAAKTLIQSFFSELKGELVGAMKRGGPMEALQVCQHVAPAIAHHHSANGWEVGRTALRARNAGNQPDAWEQQVLTQFEQQKAAGTPVDQLMHAELVTENGQRYFRMMKAIPTGEVCLKCHGKAIADPVAAKIKQLYPEDQATGFSLGDIRGAFTLRKAL